MANTIKSILNIINAAFNLPKKPLGNLPTKLLATGSKLRPGISPSEIASRIISRQVEAGLIVGDVFDDGQNTAQAMELIRIEEIIKALLTEAKIEIVIDPGVRVKTIGVGNLGAPVVSNGTTTSFAHGTGVIR
jgi:hypothetical protein